MTLSPAQRTEIYRHIRMVLVRHFIDMGRLTINISMNCVRLTGSLARLPGVAARLSAEIVSSLFSEIRRIPGVKRVDGYFDNWRQADGAGGWVNVDELAQGKAPPPSLRGGLSQTIDISDKDVPK